MTPLFGQTRTHVAARHALIAPDGHVPSEFPRWTGATANVIISPAMGANLSQILISFSESGLAVFDADAHEHALYVQSGTCVIGSVQLEAGSYYYSPPETELNIVGSPDTKLTVFRKTYEHIEGEQPPPITHGHSRDIPSEPFLGYENARLQTLFPTIPSFDLAMNIFTYQPGATLPFVETHIMEHGLLMLSGQGIYRLEDKILPRAKRRRHLDGPLLPPMVRSHGRRTRRLPLLQKHQPPPIKAREHRPPAGSGENRSI